MGCCHGDMAVLISRLHILPHVLDTFTFGYTSDSTSDSNAGMGSHRPRVATLMDLSTVLDKNMEGWGVVVSLKAFHHPPLYTVFWLVCSTGIF